MDISVKKYKTLSFLSWMADNLNKAQNHHPGLQLKLFSLIVLALIFAPL